MRRKLAIWVLVAAAAVMPCRAADSYQDAVNGQKINCYYVTGYAYFGDLENGGIIGDVGTDYSAIARSQLARLVSAL